MSPQIPTTIDSYLSRPCQEGKQVHNGILRCTLSCSSMVEPVSRPLRWLRTRQVWLKEPPIDNAKTADKAQIQSSNAGMIEPTCLPQISTNIVRYQKLLWKGKQGHKAYWCAPWAALQEWTCLSLSSMVTWRSFQEDWRNFGLATSIYQHTLGTILMLQCRHDCIQHVSLNFQPQLVAPKTTLRRPTGSPCHTDTNTEWLFNGEHANLSSHWLHRGASKKRRNLHVTT